MWIISVNLFGYVSCFNFFLKRKVQQWSSSIQRKQAYLLKQICPNYQIPIDAVPSLWEWQYLCKFGWSTLHLSYQHFFQTSFLDIQANCSFPRHVCRNCAFSILNQCADDKELRLIGLCQNLLNLLFRTLPLSSDFGINPSCIYICKLIQYNLLVIHSNT